jgi:exo-poly-alpha-galacturonosidase
MFSLYVLIILIFHHILAQDYNVTTFGAVGDGKTDDTNAIRAAFSAANNGGRVIFDVGSTFLTGSFVMSNNTILDVRGTILGTTLPEKYEL